MVLGIDSLNGDFIQGSGCALERFSKMSMFFASPYVLSVVRSAILLLSGSSFTLISRNPSDLIMRAHHLFDNNVPLSLDMLASIVASAQSEIHGCVVGQASHNAPKPGKCIVVLSLEPLFASSDQNHRVSVEQKRRHHQTP